jgi:hypothetical protein
MAVDQSALLELLEMMRSADDGELRSGAGPRARPTRPAKRLAGQRPEARPPGWCPDATHAAAGALAAADRDQERGRSPAQRLVRQPAGRAVTGAFAASAGTTGPAR